MSVRFRLSDQQWDIFDLLASRQAVSKRAIRIACFSDRLDCDVPRSADKIIDVQVHRMRKRLALRGIELLTPALGGGGFYKMPPASRALARRIIAARQACA